MITSKKSTLKLSSPVLGCFGQAFHVSNVFETGIAQAVMQLGFLGEQMERLKQDGPSFDRRQDEADYHAFMNHQHAKTRGNLITALQELVQMEPELTENLAAKARRNFLVHHFFRDRAELFATRHGRDKMIAEADEALALFDKVDRNLDKFMQPHRAKMGISEAAPQAETERCIRSIFDADD